MSGKDCHKSGKDCGKHGPQWRRHKVYRLVFAGLLLLTILVLLAILIVWLVLRPSKPKFYLQDASVAQLNLSTGVFPGLLTTVLQVTLSSRNPNDRIGIYYDRLVAYGQYKGQQITAATVLPAGYQGHNDVTVWSPYLYGVAVPIAPYLTDSLAQDQAAGYILLYVRVDGRLRWKVGTWVSGQYHIHANCPAFLTLDTGKSHTNPDASSSYSFRFQQIAACSVDI